MADTAAAFLQNGVKNFRNKIKNSLDMIYSLTDKSKVIHTALLPSMSLEYENVVN